MRPNDFLEFVFVFLVFGGGFWILSPLARALAKRIGSRSGAAVDPAVLERFETELHELRQEMAELSERVDFTERVLAKAKETGRLGPSS
jgi:hypothetical protein